MYQRLLVLHITDSFFFSLKSIHKLNLQISFLTFMLKIIQIMNVESNENKSNFLAFTIAGEITVGTSAATYLFSSVANLSEDAASTNNRDTISGLTKLVIVVGCIGVLLICLHFILCLRENTCRSSDQLIL